MLVLCFTGLLLSAFAVFICHHFVYLFSVGNIPSLFFGKKKSSLIGEGMQCSWMRELPKAETKTIKEKLDMLATFVTIFF